MTNEEKLIGTFLFIYTVGSKEMIETILTISGGVLLVFCVIFYWRDCRGKPSATMGGETSFSVYWTLAVTPLLLGSLPVIGLSRWWTIPGTIGLYVLSFPIRIIMQHFFCTPFEEKPTGFQGYVRKTEGTANKTIDSD